MHLTLFETGGLLALAQVVMIDIVLAGDNAVVIGLAAARVPPQIRRKVILSGLAAALVLRIVLAIVTVQLMQIIGLTLAGRHPAFMGELAFLARHFGRAFPAHAAMDANDSLRRAILQIVFADISMSLDNVLAVAGAARDHRDVLIIGLLLSVALMGMAANLIARLLERYRWVSYIGLAIVIYVALSMIWNGSHAVMRALT